MPTPSFVQNANDHVAPSSSSKAVSLPASPTSGNLLVAAVGVDKNSGYTLSGAGTWTQVVNLTSTSVSQHVFWKVSDGTETSITFNRSSGNSTSGDNLWVGEYSSTGSTWSVVASATNNSDETNVTSWSSGTTGNATADGLAICFHSIDTMANWPTGGSAPTWSNSFTGRRLRADQQSSNGGAGGLLIAEKALSSGTSTSCTISYTGTGDQHTGSVVAFGKTGGTPITVNCGLASETDTVPGAVVRRKTRTTGLPTEADQASALLRLKVKAIGLASETDSGLAATAVRTRRVATGLASETDSVPGAVVRLKTRATGLPTETDSGLAAGRVKTKATGLPTEADTVPGVLGRVKTRAAGLPTETDTTFTVGRLKVRVLGLPTEVDTALILRGRLGLAEETDTAWPVTVRKTRTTGLATEADTALTTGRAKRKSTGLPTETDATFTVGRVKSRTTGLPVETDTALTTGKAKRKALGLAAAVETALAAVRVKSRQLGQATTTETSFTPGKAKRRTLGLASTVDAALSIVQALDAAITAAISAPQWKAVSVTTPIVLGTTEWLRVPVTYTVQGVAQTIDAQTVEFSIDRATWVAAAWEGAASTTRTARLAPGSLFTRRGYFDVFVRVTDGALQPVVRAGVVRVV